MVKTHLWDIANKNIHSGSIPSINVSGSQDNNTTNRSTHGGSDTSANSSGTAQSNNNTRSQQSRNSGGLTGIFN